MENFDKIIDAINEVNNISWFDWTQLLVSVFFSVITFWVAFLTFKLQKKTKEDEDKEKRLNEIQHINNIYYFLNDVIHKMADVEFEYIAFENIVVDGQKFMDDINYLRNRYITNEEFNLLREIYALYDGIRIEPKKNEKNFKILYKKVIDTNIEPIEIPNYRDNNDFDFITSIRLLMILKKFEYILNDKIDTINKNIIIDFNKSSTQITKKYDKKYYLKNNSGNIVGIVKKYESVFHFDKDKIYLTYELIYDGSVKDNYPDGNGKYYYYTDDNGFEGKVNSWALEKKGVNYDQIAQEIKSYVSSESSNGHFKAVLDGSFSNNSIKSGLLKYSLAFNSEEKEMKIGNK